MSSREIGSGIVGRLWRWLQNSSAVWRSLVLLVVYISAGLSLEQLADQYRSYWQVQPWDPAAGLHIVLLFGFGLRYIFLEKQLRYDATHDNLTGLYNRAWFLDRLEQTQNQANENKNYLYAVLFLDLDRFKTVNDSLGHLIGDRLLILIAQKLRECLPEHTSIARLGGDEFTIILEDISDIDRVSQIAEAICHNLGQTYIIDRYQLFITVSIGIAVNSSASQSLNLLRDADIALYEAKAKGKSQYVVFDSQMYERVVTKTELEQDLRQAINELDIPQ